MCALKYRLGANIYRTAGPCPAFGAHSDTLGDHALCCGSAGQAGIKCVDGVLRPKSFCKANIDEIYN